MKAVTLPGTATSGSAPEPEVLPPRRSHGGWQPGDPPGNRRFQDLFRQSPMQLESGRTLGPITLAYESWGRLDGRAGNGVLLLHGFSGDSHAAGPPEAGHPQRGWWDSLVGPGQAIDTDRFHVVCANVLGGCQGSTGPATLSPDGRPWGSRFPELTIRDQVAAETALAESLGIRRWHAVIGGSMGGMRALEWAVGHPERVGRLVLLATASHCSPDNLAFHYCQMQAIQLDPLFRGGDYYDAPQGGPARGLALARAIARLTYGGATELEERCAEAEQRLRQALSLPVADRPDTDRATRQQAAAHILETDGRSLVERFDANTYLTLTRAMDSHDVGRGRGGWRAALGRIRAPVHVVAVRSDRLFPPQRQRELADAIGGDVTLTELNSDLGHDAFLEEHLQLEPILRRALA